MNTITFIMIATIVVYLLGMLAIGFIFSKNNNDSTDFYLGGRKMGPLVTAMSAEASDMSSWLLMGIPGLAYFSGIAGQEECSECDCCACDYCILYSLYRIRL